MNHKILKIGIDIGSTTVKVVVLNEENKSSISGASQDGLLKELNV